MAVQQRVGLLPERRSGSGGRGLTGAASGRAALKGYEASGTLAGAFRKFVDVGNVPTLS